MRDFDTNFTIVTTAWKGKHSVKERLLLSWNASYYGSNVVKMEIWH